MAKILRSDLAQQTNGTFRDGSSKIKYTWEYEKIQACDCKEMNKALIKRFRSLLD